MNKHRLKAEIRVYYGNSQEIMLSGYSIDLSSGGLYIKTELPFDVGEDLMLTFTLSEQNKEKVSCRARVAWVNNKKDPSKPKLPPGMGVEFVDLSPEDLASISSFMEIEPVW